VTGKSATKIVPSSIRRLTDKGSSTATRILEEAKNILVEDGFLGLSFRAIAKRTGTTVGNIGYYSGTKDDLMVVRSIFSIAGNSGCSGTCRRP
jgi:DNA-binding transcriptional regulator YbjK